MIVYECERCHRVSVAKQKDFRDKLYITEKIEKRVLVICPQCSLTKSRR